MIMICIVMISNAVNWSTRTNHDW